MSAEAPRLVANPRELPGALVAVCVALMLAGALLGHLQRRLSEH